MQPRHILPRDDVHGYCSGTETGSAQAYKMNEEGARTSLSTARDAVDLPINEILRTLCLQSVAVSTYSLTTINQRRCGSDGRMNATNRPASECLTGGQKDHCICLAGICLHSDAFAKQQIDPSTSLQRFSAADRPGKGVRCMGASLGTIRTALNSFNPPGSSFQRERLTQHPQYH